MKALYFILVLILAYSTLSAVQPVRKPFLRIKIDGKQVKTGELLSITRGQKMKIEVEMEGGRRDFCKFPDEYANISGNAQILSRGDKSIVYEIEGKKAEWTLTSENVQFSGDKYITVEPIANQLSANLLVSNEKFAQSFIKATVKSTWQFKTGENVTQEEYSAEATVYFKVAGESDVWYMSKLIKASGIKNDVILEKLAQFQVLCDSIERNLYQLKFPLAQHNIRNLQTISGEIKSSIDEIKAANSTAKIDVVFTGLPSDEPYLDISMVTEIKNKWMPVDSLLSDIKQNLDKLPEQGNTESQNTLAKLIRKYLDWQAKLPEKSVEHLSLYIPHLQADNIIVPTMVEKFAKSVNSADYSKVKNEFGSFIEMRNQKAGDELMSINSVSTRIQAVRLFDGMLRSFFASIEWADWINTRK